MGALVMPISSWRSFGASVRGPGHVVTGVPNQDSWSSFHHLWGDGVVMSDGLGSRSMSDFGSSTVCFAVERAVSRLASFGHQANRPAFFDDVREGWLDAISPLDPTDALATCLFAFRINDGQVRLGMLGDGCVAAIGWNGKVTRLLDDKATGFSNVTTALGPSTTDKDWVVAIVPESECRAVVLCTDGVADDLDDADGFMLSLVERYSRESALVASSLLVEVLDSWPVPNHSDDKTIACLQVVGENLD